jgi:hypothetical protein
MALTIKADNRQLLKGQKYSFLSNNYASGVSSVVVDNGAGFTADDYLLFGNFGSETAEIVQLSSITTNTMTLKTNTKFAHPESTKITILQYNQVKFYHTAAATFSSTEDYLTAVDIEADSLFTKYTDTAHTTGFDWFCFYNETTDAITSQSNAIPLAGFGDGSVKKILDDFFSLLNDKELKVITMDDAFSWLNEAYGLARTELNLINNEYTVSTSYSISVTSGTSEYALPTGFSSLISVYNDTDDVNIDTINASEVDSYNRSDLSTIKTYLRGSYIGFAPTPTSNFTAYIRYKTNYTKVTSYYDNIDLPGITPDNLKDYMMFRACKKLGRVDAKDYYDIFKAEMDRMKVSNIKRDSGLDSWSIASEANV